MSLSETFAIFLDSDSHSRDYWERSVDDPRLRAHMLDFVYKIARQHHSLFESAYAPFQLSYKPHLFVEMLSIPSDIPSLVAYARRSAQLLNNSVASS